MIALFIGLLFLVTGPSAPAPVPTFNAALKRCVEADVRLDVKLSTAVNVAGDGFRFKTTGYIPRFGSQPAITGGTPGYGVIAYSSHAGAGGQAGMMILEPRYIVLPDGRHIQVMADPSGPNRIRSGKNKNAPGILEQLPLIGMAAGGYNALHRGKEVVLDKETLLPVLVGDGLADSACYVVLPTRQ